MEHSQSPDEPPLYLQPKIMAQAERDATLALHLDTLIIAEQAHLEDPDNKSIQKIYERMHDLTVNYLESGDARTINPQG